MSRRIWILALGLASLTTMLHAQDDDRSYLEGLLEDTLSDAGRAVNVSGFTGALSSRATIEQITIADDEGIWITIDGIVLDWRRSALLRGALEVNEFSADSIVMTRPPAEEPNALPAPEATPFALPELPVTINIGNLQIGQATFDAAVLGQSLTAGLTGSALLEGGNGSLDLVVNRQDNVTGRIALSGAYSNSDRQLSLDLSVTEAESGLIATSAGLPGAPAIELAVTGSGPIDEFDAAFRLGTSGESRLSGTYSTSKRVDDAGNLVSQTHAAELSGDVTPILLPDYRDFFGDSLQLALRWHRPATGGTEITELDLRAREISLQGNASLNADNWPTRFDVLGRIGIASGETVRLPVPDADLRIKTAEFSLAHDASSGNSWQAKATVQDIEADGLKLASAVLDGRGSINLAATTGLNAADGTLGLRLSGLSSDLDALGVALGPSPTAQLDFGLADGQLLIPVFSASGAGNTVSGSLAIRPDADNLNISVDGQTALDISDLDGFSELAGMNISGSASAQLDGRADFPSGAFDARLSANLSSFRMVQPQLAPLVSGDSALTVEAQRGPDGLVVPLFEIANDRVSATGRADIASERSEVELSARLTDASLLANGLTGPLDLAATASSQAKTWQVAATANAGGASARVNGSYDLDRNLADVAADGAIRLELLNPFLSPQVAVGELAFDLALSGPPVVSALAGTLRTEDAALSLPDLGIGLDPIRANVTLGQGQAQLNLRTTSTSGGQITVAGPIALDDPFDARLSVELASLGLNDPKLYRTSASGRVNLVGPLAGLFGVFGKIELGAVELRLNDPGLVDAPALPGLVHRGATAAVRETQDRAGLIEVAETETMPYPLDIRVDAPNRIFVRGRGLDAELGGSIILGGTAIAVTPAGRFELIRGRLDLLGQRFNLTEGYANLEGSFDPYLRLVAETETDDASVQIVVEGPASQPTVRFTSSDGLPEEEVLARLIFGKGITQISPLQAAQLGLAVAQLGGGGGGVVDTIRDRFGLDDLDFTTNDAGNATARFGRYLGENIYSDVAVDTEGQAEVNLNLTITPQVTLRGKVDSAGETSLGIFYENDY